jgi:hypothetical protein
VRRHVDDVATVNAGETPRKLVVKRAIIELLGSAGENRGGRLGEGNDALDLGAPEAVIEKHRNETCLFAGEP